MPKKEKNIVTGKDFIKQAVNLIDAARQQAVRQTNSLMVFTYFHLGKLIVEQEQGGKIKAAYSNEVIKELSKALTRKFGNGFSSRNLASIRLFYQIYHPQLTSPILQTVSAKSGSSEKTQTPPAESSVISISITDSIKSFAELFSLS